MCTIVTDSHLSGYCQLSYACIIRFAFQGVVPATIAIKNGVFRVGLHPDEMENLALAGEEGRAIKCSTRDLPLVASKHCNMSTTLEGNNDQWGGMLWYILKCTYFSLACFFGLFQVDINAESSYNKMQLQPQP